jgi:hypothetical protein
MPFSERGEMKLDGKRSVEHLEKSAEYLLRLRAKYDPPYPDRVQVIDSLLTALSELRDLFVEFSHTI